ncbi:glycosyltransferase family 2 protein [Dethiosulfatarculus sandiegensis]|uniref:glycosyltransferase family 2 protein n=1 Tax=Dethiosulfatarculus sandiegensis TaxID=1429043 RepID=UPI0005C9F20D|nr:glycosyltransferase family 2 protein [Dethiosulfatarculus sandiegensis]
MPGLSAALICRNEEENLPAWLESVSAFADEVVAVDSGSTDNSLAVLKEAGAKVRSRDWTGYADQRNAAMDMCTGDWIVFLDADELVDPELAASLNSLKQDKTGEYAGYELAFKVFFFGRFLRHGGFFPEHHLRLFQRGKGGWAKRQVHERLEVQGKVGRLPGYVEHYSYDTVGEYISRMQTYSEQAARQMHLSGKKTTPLDAWFHGFWSFFNRYLLRGGFLDGFQGYLAARMESLYTLTKYTRLWEMKKGGAQKHETE